MSRNLITCCIPMSRSSLTSVENCAIPQDDSGMKNRLERLEAAGCTEEDIIKFTADRIRKIRNANA